MQSAFLTISSVARRSLRGMPFISPFRLFILSCEVFTTAKKGDLKGFPKTARVFSTERDLQRAINQRPLFRILWP